MVPARGEESGEGFKSLGKNRVNCIKVRYIASICLVFIEYDLQPYFTMNNCSPSITSIDIIAMLMTSSKKCLCQCLPYED